MTIMFSTGVIPQSTSWAGSARHCRTLGTENQQFVFCVLGLYTQTLIETVSNIASVLVTVLL